MKLKGDNSAQPMGNKRNEYHYHKPVFKHF